MVKSLRRAAALGLAAIMIAAGCGKKEDTYDPNQKPGPVMKGPGMMGAGQGGPPGGGSPQATFSANCAKCHALEGVGQPNPNGISLNKIGANHDATAIAKVIREGIDKGKKKMPAFTKEQISDDDVKALAEFLATKK